MRDVINHLKVASAMSEQRRGVIDYDRLASAGLPGEIVRTNILSRLVDDTSAVNRDYLTKFNAARKGRVDFGLGGTISYPHGGLMLADFVVLTAELVNPNTGLPASRGVTRAQVSYGLANESSETWNVLDITKESDKGPDTEHEHSKAEVFGRYDAPYGDLQRRIGYDFQQVLEDPVRFMERTTERFIGAEGVAKLGFLGHDIVAALVTPAAGS